MSEDRGKLSGVFTIEKYKAEDEERLAAFNARQSELMARMHFQKKLAESAANNGDAQGYTQHAENADNLWQQACFEKDMFAEKFATDVTQFNNGLLNGGITLMWQLITGASSVHFDNTNSRLVVGTSNTAFSASQTGVQSSLATLTMDATYPTISAQSATWRATAGTSAANGSWQEFCVTNNTTAMNRAVSNQGTKTSSDIWVPSLTITLS